MLNLVELEKQEEGASIKIIKSLSIKLI
jgi:hypothetical protein